MIPPFSERPAWLKSRGYLHITPKIDVYRKYEEYFTKINDDNFVARHGFFPLIHSIIKERKYKKTPSGQRAHSYFEDNEYHRTAKLRPLHYATHIDALIYGRYAEKLLNLYEDELNNYEGLSDCVIAYRKIPEQEFTGTHETILEKVQGKSTIHFASEAFQEIKERAKDGCVVLMFDIKSFFSELNHQRIKKLWCDLLGVDRLPAADFNVYNSATQFRYILRDELRVKQVHKGKRAGFNEKKLAFIRKNQGIEAFFESVEDFRNAIEQKRVKVYKDPFVKKGKPVGIPQGLPISAVIANLYLLEFDISILQNIVDARGGYYRRYSDDIMIICKPDEAKEIEAFVLEEIEKSKVEISKQKTESFLFETATISPKISQISAYLINDKTMTIGKPLTYLGFEFYGYQTLIKSSNLSRYYRRMIGSVKRKSRTLGDTSEKKVVFPQRLKKIHRQINLGKEKVVVRHKRLVKNNSGFYSFKFRNKKVKSGGSYISYATRASKHMSAPYILNQIRKSKSIFHKAMANHLKEKK
jgi:hypothetical protein